MKPINLLSLVQAKKDLHSDKYKNYLNFYGINPKDKEVDDIERLMESVFKIKNEMKLLDNYYVGYTIPQIGKEFDLLRFGDNYVINIELKSYSTEDKILNQLVKNKYYLSFLNRKVHYFTFVSSEKKLYYLNNSDDIEEVDCSFLVNYLLNQQIEFIESVHKLFNPSDYLVSPFNSTDKFMNNEYFLTNQQKEIKKKILKDISDTSKSIFIALTGAAGTGKTLLTYDIAKDFIQNGKKVLVIHCGQLNSGQEKLNNKYGWEIIPIKDYSTYNLSNYNLLVIDESQRIYEKQFKDIVTKVQKNSGSCIFSYDKVQTLATWEENRNISEKIESLSSKKKYKLSEKIRTNKEIANFIKKLFNKKRNDIKVESKDNIEINYFHNEKETKAYLEYIKNLGWQVLSYTPSLYKNYYYEKFQIVSLTSHEAIGQEFDNVAIVINDKFKYNDEGKLHYFGATYYHPVKMLWQNLTRTRKKLNIIVVNNEEILKRCLEIIGK